MIKAASQTKMNSLHDRVADVFLKVLQRYHDRMAVVDAQIEHGALENIDALEADFIIALCDDGALPSPSMMAAITKFLKDNEVLFEKDKIDQISDQQRALEEKRKNRPNLSQLTVVPMVAAG